MLKYIAILFTGVLTSFYFFPFEFAILPGANTKMVMAGVSLIVLGLQLAKKRSASIGRDFLILTILAGLVSLSGLVAVSYNETNDYTYATYIVSMWVWLGGAYLTVCCMRWLHNDVSVKLIAHYLIGVCVAQCVLALLIDAIPAFKLFVNTYVSGFDWVQFEQLEKEEIEIPLTIELSKEIGEGTYANLTVISHSTSEFILDFVRVMPGLEKAPVKNRIILTPEHAKRLLMSLTENISKYEQIFGEIKIPVPINKGFNVKVKGEA